MPQRDLLQNIQITGYRPEVATQIIPILARYFLSQWGNDSEFKRRLAAEVQAYLIEMDNPVNSSICAWMDGKLAGVISIDGSCGVVQGGWIRWFIVTDEFRHAGLGGFLFEKAAEYCKKRGFTDVFVSTYKGKDPAVGLYEKNGFLLHREEDFSTSLTKITKQWFIKTL